MEGPKRPKDYTIISKRKGFLRFHTPDIENMLSKLVKYEEEFKKQFIPFIFEYFRKFYKRHATWQQLISCLAELDCLCSLAILANSMKSKCLPKFLPNTEGESVFKLQDMVHPLVANNKIDFVPNNVVTSDSANIFLITGPNMGGKSTLLRQTCLATIMAQVGSFVPAKEFMLTAVDRIFTRIGASDRLMEGKSTFYIEMEETYHIVTQATRNSLLIIDELGRGTSTYDGLAIAYATLKYISESLKCVTLFATHYHSLLKEFNMYKNIADYVMASEFNKEKDEIKFLYKFIRGKADKSHGIMIARAAGLPKSIALKAQEKALEISNDSDILDQLEDNEFKFKSIIEMMTKIKRKDDCDINDVLSQMTMV